MHDDYVDRTTDGHGAVTRMSLLEVKRLDAGSWFSKQYNGVRVPTLDEIFGNLGNRSRYMIDIRKRETIEGFSNRDMVRRVADSVIHHGLQPKVSFSSDDEATIRLLKEMLPSTTVLAKINVLYTLASLSTMWQFVDRSGADGVSAHFLMALLHNTMIETSKQRGKKVFIFTVDSMYVSKWLECLGVDGIVSNSPEKIVSVSKCPITGAYDQPFEDPRDPAAGT